MSSLSVYVWTNIIKQGRVDTVMVGIWTKLVNQPVSWMAYCILVVSHQKRDSVYIFLNLNIGHLSH